MDDVKQGYAERVEEIKLYLKYLELLNNEELALHFGDRIVEINEKFIVTLTANSILLFYNLVESTITNTIIALYDIINDDNLSFCQLSENFQMHWAKFQVKNILGGKCLEKFFINAQNLAENMDIIFEQDWLNFSGNLDAKKIRKIAKELGIEEPDNGRELLDIKNKRNRLAHGERTFYDIGKDYTVNDIKILSNSVQIFLEDFINKAEKFISQQQYKKHEY